MPTDNQTDNIKPIRVLHIGKYYPPFMGGTEKVNYDIVEGLNHENGYVIDELCFAHTRDFHEELKVDYRLFRVPIFGIKFSTPIPKGFFTLYRKIRNNYDIIHLHMPNPLVSLGVLLYKTNAKLILHWHMDIVKQKKLKMLYRPLQTAILKRCNKIIATSPNYARCSRDLAPYLDKVSIVPIGIDVDYLPYDEKDVKQIRSAFPGKKIVFSVGRLTYYKGFSVLIEAARYLSDDVVVLIGGKGEEYEKLQSMIKTSGLENKVRLLGRVPERLMGAYYKAADLFCLPSRYRTEAFGVVLLEAMAFGLPIVACNIEGSGVSWVNSHQETGLNVAVGDPGALAQAIDKILGDPNKYNEYSNNALSRYENNFKKSNMLDRVKEIYDNI